jgi:dynein light intermediate chain 1, cytosolic
MNLHTSVLDILARLSIYLLSDPSPSFAPLLRPLLTPISIPETLIVILLDWTNPWTWVRQLREWIRLLRSVLVSLDSETKFVMEEVMTEWRGRRRGLDASSGTGVANSGGPFTIPLGPGEWDEGLGIPMCVVCQGVRMEQLSWILAMSSLLADSSLTLCDSFRLTRLRSWKKSTVGEKRNSILSFNL